MARSLDWQRRKKVVQLWLTPRYHEALRRRAADENEPMTRVVIQALKEYLNKPRRMYERTTQEED